MIARVFVRWVTSHIHSDFGDLKINIEVYFFELFIQFLQLSHSPDIFARFDYVLCIRLIFHHEVLLKLLVQLILSQEVSCVKDSLFKHVKGRMKLNPAHCAFT